MREQPFIEAVNNLRKDQELKNLEMIIEIQKNKSKWNQNAPSQQQIPGVHLHKQLYQQAQENFTISDKKEAYDGQSDSYAGRVTFRNVQGGHQTEQIPSFKSRQSNRTNKIKAGDGGDGQDVSKMLKTEEIREICDAHQLTRMEVYNIRS